MLIDRNEVDFYSLDSKYRVIPDACGVSMQQRAKTGLSMSIKQLASDILTAYYSQDWSRLSYLLEYGFDWESTRQGHEFWMELCSGSNPVEFPREAIIQLNVWANL